MLLDSLKSEKKLSKFGLALSIVATVFKDKVDQGGQPYFLHCYRVMNGITSTNEDVKIAAILHDVVEDTDYTFRQLEDLGFSVRTMDLLRLVTHDKSISYDDYIKRISTDLNAVDIKLSDLRDNMSASRLKGLRQKDFDRMEKYSRNYIRLKDIHDDYYSKVLSEVVY